MYVLLRSKKTGVGRGFSRVLAVRIEKVGGVSHYVVYDQYGRVHGADCSMPTREYRIEEAVSREIS